MSKRKRVGIWSLVLTTFAIIAFCVFGTLELELPKVLAGSLGIVFGILGAGLLDYQPSPLSEPRG